MEKDNKKLPFLDNLLYKNGGKLHMDILHKDTPTHQYLNYNSCHPKHEKRNIPYSLAGRIWLIVSQPDVRRRRLAELEHFLRKQNYPKNIISKGIEKATSLTVMELKSTKRTIENKGSLQLVITHNPNSPQIIGKIKEDLNFLHNCHKMKRILDKTNFIITQRQPKN